MIVHQGLPVSGYVNRRMTFTELSLQFPVRTQLIQRLTVVSIRYRRVVGTLPQSIQMSAIQCYQTQT